MSLIFLVVMGSSLWVLFDAKALGVGTRVLDGRGDSGPWTWFFGCLLLWILAFPLYLVKRGRYTRPVSGPAQTVEAIGHLERLSRLREQGVLSDDEFVEQKRRVLAGAPSVPVVDEKRRRSGARVDAFIVGGLFLGVLAVGVVVEFATGTPPNIVRSQAISAQQSRMMVDDTEVAAWQGLTLKNYFSIHEGMSHAEVATILGTNGTENSRVSLGNIQTVMYMWTSSPMTSMTAMFQNDRLVSKAQLGIK